MEGWEPLFQFLTAMAKMDNAVAERMPEGACLLGSLRCDKDKQRSGIDMKEYMVHIGLPSNGRLLTG
jgi:hypothetical protein